MFFKKNQIVNNFPCELKDIEGKWKSVLNNEDIKNLRKNKDIKISKKDSYIIFNNGTFYLSNKTNEQEVIIQGLVSIEDDGLIVLHREVGSLNSNICSLQKSFCFNDVNIGYFYENYIIDDVSSFVKNIFGKQVITFGDKKCKLIEKFIIDMDTFIYRKTIFESDEEFETEEMGQVINDDNKMILKLKDESFMFINLNNKIYQVNFLR